GLETRLFELLAVAGVLRVAEEVEALRDARWIPGARSAALKQGAGRIAPPSELPVSPSRPIGALLLGLAALTRPDGVLVGGAALGAALACVGREKRGAWLKRCAPWLGLVAAHQIFRLAYYHAWLPNTYFAKVGGRAEWGPGLEYLAAFALEYAGFLWAPLV